MPGRALIVGGAGQIGLALRCRLAGQGWEVVSLQRASNGATGGGDRITVVHGDRENDEDLAAALGNGADLVVDTVAYTVKHGEQLRAHDDRIGCLVVVSSASVYCDDFGRSLDEASGESDAFPNFSGPISETQPTVPPGNATYSTRKVALESAVLERRGGQTVVFRPCAIHGIGSRHPREWWFVKRVIDGRRAVPLGYGGRSLFHTTAAENIAAMVEAAYCRRFSGILNVGDPDPPTVWEIGCTVASALHHEWRLVPLPDEADLSQAGSSPWSVPLPFRLDMSLAASIGYTPATTYADAAAPYCRWLVSAAAERGWRAAFPALAAYPVNLFNYSAEDAVLSSLMRSSTNTTYEP